MNKKQILYAVIGKMQVGQIKRSKRKRVNQQLYYFFSKLDLMFRYLSEKELFEYDYCGSYAEFMISVRVGKKLNKYKGR